MVCGLHGTERHNLIHWINICVVCNGHYALPLTTSCSHALQPKHDDNGGFSLSKQMCMNVKCTWIRIARRVAHEMFDWEKTARCSCMHDVAFQFIVPSGSYNTDDIENIPRIDRFWKSIGHICLRIQKCARRRWGKWIRKPNWFNLPALETF